MSLAKITEWGRCIVLVTGASKGLGAAICEELARKIGHESVIVGMARSKQGLENTGAKVNKANPQVKFIVKEFDLINVDSEIVTGILKDAIRDQTFERAILIHNVGSLGPLKCVKNIASSVDVKLHSELNYSSLIPTTYAFFKLIEENQKKAAIHVVNISSLAAIQPIKATGLYCAMKAARNMIFKVLAAEEPHIDVLNYAPGPLETDMQTEIRENVEDSEVQKSFQSMKDNNTLVDVNVSAKKMISVMENKTYKSGDHVDFYD